MNEEWADDDRVAEYLSREIPFRDEAEKLLIEAAPAHVETAMDLGCGDGRLAELVSRARPTAAVSALDNSDAMLIRARTRLAGVSQVRMLAHDLRDQLPPLGPMDLIVSGLAIHHLVDERKRGLFGEILDVLRPGGAFINLDLYSSPTEAAHARFRELIGRAEDDPSDCLQPLSDQLECLQDLGFTQVECWFKWRELGLVVALRPQ